MHVKKHLNFTALREVAQESFAEVPDNRATNVSNSVRDVMSAVVLLVCIFNLHLC